MTVCEYIWEQYTRYNKATDREKGRMGGVILVEQGTFEHFKVFCRNICEGGYVKQLEKVGITLDQLKAAKEAGYMKRQEYTNWEARQLGRTTAYWLTNKGIKTIWNYYTK